MGMTAEFFTSHREKLRHAGGKAPYEFTIPCNVFCERQHERVDVMEKKNTKNPLRFAVLLILFIALPFARHRVRSHARDYINQQLPHQVTQQELDYANLIAQETGENVSVCSTEEHDSINGTPDFAKVVFATGQEGAYTNIGCMIFDKQEINKKVGFMNFVSGYDNVPDKTVYAHILREDESGFTIYDFDTIKYENTTFWVSHLYIVTDNRISLVEVVFNSGEKEICDESRCKNIYEISDADRHKIDKICFYDSELNLLSEYYN